MSWTDNHGPDRLYDKFRVIRQSTGELIPDDEFVFVLRPEFDEAACSALTEYAVCVAGRSPNLARELLEIVERIRAENQ